ncbi:MAG: NADH-quinone oxidoreductase subunit H [Chthoniobacterales bacterium]|nr:NADH-quinone oxidoreductase subunit H [Chthoniobacterales bacterium]
MPSLDIFLQPEIFLVWTSALKTSVLLGIVLTMVAYSVWAERKVSAFIQDRIGPNRVGWAGLIQPIADGVKLLLKENFVPAGVNKFYFSIAPSLAMVPAILVLAVLPFGSTLFGVPMVIANLDIGVLWVFAVSSLGVYGIVLAGWSSNSKYSFLGGIRSSSQMISYELSLGLAVVPVFMITGTLNLGEIVQYQIQNGWMVFPLWFTGGDALMGFSLEKTLLCIPMLISFVVFVIAMFAETNRMPFDLPEAEQELVAGYHTEYSSMRFALFFLGEYAAIIAGSGVIVTLFLGGWSLPFIPDGSQCWLWGLVNIGVFFSKVAALIFFFLWVRWTLPRFRFDQLMKLGWYVFFEVALVNIFITAGILAYLNS